MTEQPTSSEPDDTPEDEPDGSMRPISGGALAGCAVVGMFAGWAVHPVAKALGGTAPLVSWGQALALVLVATIMAFLAGHTWRTVQVRRRRLAVHHAVNRLVLARACALAGALVAGGYLGYAISWLGDPSALADERLVRSLVAAAGAVATTIASLVLERACRTPQGPPRA